MNLYSYLQYFCINILLTICINSDAQTFKEQELIGTIQLTDQTIITYKINFSESKNGQIKGISISDIYGDNKTSTTIEGYIDHKKKKISFKEIKNIRTRSNSNVSDFCYIDLQDANLKDVDGKSIIQGRFTGRYINGDICASGSIYLVSSGFIKKLASKIPEDIKNDTINLIKSKLNDIENTGSFSYLRGNETLNLNWKTKELIIEIWDSKDEDNDEIDLIINNKKVLDRFIMKREKKILVIPIESNINFIQVKGVSEGMKSPCTTNIFLRDGEKIFSFICELKKGESTYFNLKSKNE